MQLPMILLTNAVGAEKIVFFFANGTGHVQLKRILRKKMALMKLEDIVQHKDLMAKKFCEKKFLKYFLLVGLLK